MRPVKRINSERLKEARLYRKMTMEEVADIVEVNKQAISQFENGKATSEPLTLKRIADALGFPYAFFAETSTHTLIGNTYFRSLYSSRKKDLVSQQIKTKYLTQIYMILREKVRFKPLNLPDLSYNSPATIEEIAKEVRDYWQLGDSPIPNMVALLEKNGIVVGEFATDSREIDAFYQYTEEDCEPVFCVVLGTDKKSFYRRQFNCAHELGHILLHERYSDLDEIDRDEFRERENQANAFASAFLLPQTSFGKDVSLYPNRLSYYVELKKKWHVSIMAMIIRAHTLNIISTNQYTYLMRQMSMKNYRQNEPLDDLVAYKHPRALRQAIDILMTQGKYTSEKIMQLFSDHGFSVSPNIIEELLDLEPGKLSSHYEEDNVVFLSERV